MRPELPEPRASWEMWSLATGIAGVVMALTIVSYFHAFVFTRTEGEEVQKRISELETHYREDVSALRGEMEEVLRIETGRHRRDDESLRAPGSDSEDKTKHTSAAASCLAPNTASHPSTVPASVLGHATAVPALELFGVLPLISPATLSN